MRTDIDSPVPTWLTMQSTHNAQLGAFAMHSQAQCDCASQVVGLIASNFIVSYSTSGPSANPAATRRFHQPCPSQSCSPSPTPAPILAPTIAPRASLAPSKKVPQSHRMFCTVSKAKKSSVAPKSAPIPPHRQRKPFPSSNVDKTSTSCVCVRRNRHEPWSNRPFLPAQSDRLAPSHQHLRFCIITLSYQAWLFPSLS